MEESLRRVCSLLPQTRGGRLHAAGFGAALAVASALRLYELGQGHPGLGIYTSISSNVTRSFHGWLYPSMLADGSILADKPPLFFWIQGMFFALLGPTNLAARLPTALAGIASVLLLYLIVRRCHGAAPALLAAFALAIMPLDVNYSRSTFIEPVTVVAMMGATYFVVRAVQDRREGFFYAAAAMLGAAFMVKLWQGLLPAPAFAALALTCRWTSWARLVRIAAVSAAVFLAAALWWPTLVWLTSSAYDGVMHADSVWDMIFGWNLTQRFGDLQYGANHRRDMLWFVTGPMSLFLGISLFPAAAIGAIVLTKEIWHRAHEEAYRLLCDLGERFPSVPAPERLRPRRSSFIRRSSDALLESRPGSSVGLLWLVWMLVAVIGFGGTSVRLATYWTAAAPAIAAMSGIGIATLAGYVARRDALAWALVGVAAAGSIYCAAVYDSVGHVAGYFRQAALVCWALALAVALASAVMYFEWRAFGGRLPAWTAVGACAAAALLTVVVSVHNLASPRDDTLGRIGFDMVDLPGPPQPPPASLREERARLQGSLITAIVRTDPEHLDAALDYVRQRRGDSRYLLAADTYNTASRVTFATGEPVLPLYSEYMMERIVDTPTLLELLEDGDVRFVLMASHMLRMDWELYARLRSNTRDVSRIAGLPERGEMRLLQVVKR